LKSGGLHRQRWIGGDAGVQCQKVDDTYVLRDGALALSWPPASLFQESGTVAAGTGINPSARLIPSTTNLRWKGTPEAALLRVIVGDRYAGKQEQYVCQKRWQSGLVGRLDGERGKWQPKTEVNAGGS